MKHQISFIKKPDTLKSDEMRQLTGKKSKDFCFIFDENKKWICFILACIYNST